MYNSFKENFGLPVDPLISESGYFLMINVSNCRDLIPEKYLKNHDYEEIVDG